MVFINAAAHIGLLWLTTAAWERQAPSPARAGFGGDPPPCKSPSVFALTRSRRRGRVRSRVVSLQLITRKYTIEFTRYLSAERVYK